MRQIDTATTFWGEIPHKVLDDGQATILVGNTQPHRLARLGEEGTVARTIPVEGGTEDQSLPLWAIAWGKTLTARDAVRAHPEQFGITPETPAHYFIAQDAKNDGKAKPETVAEVASNLRDILLRYHRTGRCAYTYEAATAIVNGHAEIRQTAMSIFLDHRVIQEIYENPLVFHEYLDACQEFAGISVHKVAGGLCLEALVALRAVVGIDGHPLTDQSALEQLKLIRFGIHQVLAPIPTNLLGRPNQMRTNNSPYSERVHLQAQQLQGQQVRSFATR